jgi:hypothetical protein
MPGWESGVSDAKRYNNVCTCDRGIRAVVSGRGRPDNSYAAMKNARAAALVDCERQVKAMQFGNRTVKRRNFLKDCLIDRMYYGGMN